MSDLTDDYTETLEKIMLRIAEREANQTFRIKAASSPTRLFCVDGFQMEDRVNRKVASLQEGGRVVTGVDTHPLPHNGNLHFGITIWSYDKSAVEDET